MSAEFAAATAVTGPAVSVDKTPQPASTSTHPVPDDAAAPAVQPNDLFSPRSAAAVALSSMTSHRTTTTGDKENAGAAATTTATTPATANAATNTNGPQMAALPVWKQPVPPMNTMMTPSPAAPPFYPPPSSALRWAPPTTWTPYGRQEMPVRLPLPPPPHHHHHGYGMAPLPLPHFSGRGGSGGGGIAVQFGVATMGAARAPPPPMVPPPRSHQRVMSRQPQPTPMAAKAATAAQRNEEAFTDTYIAYGDGQGHGANGSAIGNSSAMQPHLPYGGPTPVTGGMLKNYNMPYHNPMMTAVKFGTAARRSAEPWVTPTPAKKLKVEASYSRKNKSLGMLAETFLSRFASLEPGTEIVVDELAKELLVERRRIYDVVNIFEALYLVIKKGKNTYKWMGTSHLPFLFALLQDDIIDERPHIAYAAGLIEGLPAAPVATADDYSANSKSLSRLSQQFIQVFLLNVEVTSLPEASDMIHGTSTSEADLAMMGMPHNQAVPTDARGLQQAAARGLKTKIRRLYDIANVFQAVGIVAKVDDRTIDCKRPMYQWTYEKTAMQLRELYNTGMTEEMKESRSPFVDMSIVTNTPPPTAPTVAAAAAAPATVTTTMAVEGPKREDSEEMWSRLSQCPPVGWQSAEKPPKTEAAAPAPARVSNDDKPAKAAANATTAKSSSLLVQEQQQTL